MTDRLVERGAELEALRGHLDAVRAAGRGLMVFVGGEAGVGKTALVGTFAAAAPGIRLLRGWAEPLQAPRALGPLLDVAADVGDRFGELAAGGAAAVDLVAALSAALPADPTPLLVLEDVHWADAATLDFLRVLGRRLDRFPGLVLATYRDDETGRDHPLRITLGELAPEPLVHRLDVPALSEEGVAALAGPGVGAADLHRLTQGNPFYVTEVLAGGDDRVPDTVRDAVLARRGRLEAGPRAVLDAASVLPGRTELWLLDALAADAAGDVGACLASGMLVAETDAIRFRHEIARVAVEESLPPDVRRRLHQQVLAAMVARDDVDPARISHHAALAADSDAVRRYAPVAGERAAAMRAHREAADQFALALAHGPDLAEDERIRLLDRHAYECYLTDRIDDGVASRRQLLEIHRRRGDRLREGDTLRWLSRLEWFRADRAAAVTEAQQAVDLLAALPPGRELAMAYSNLGQLCMLAHDLDHTLAWSRRALDLARRLGDVEIEAHALNNAGTALANAGRDEGVADLEESLRLARVHQLEEHVARAYTNLGGAHVFWHRHDRAEQVLDEGIDYCRDHDLDSWRLYMTGWRARVHLDRGELDAAARACAVVLTNPRAALPSRITPSLVLGLIHVRRGEPGAWPLLDSALRHAGRADELQRIAPACAARAEALVVEGRTEEVGPETDAALAAAREHAEPWFGGELLVWRRRAGVADAPGSAEAATPYALELEGRHADAAAAWQELGLPYHRAWALVGSSDESLAREGVEVLRTLGAHATADSVSRRLRARGVRGLARRPRRSTEHNRYGLTQREADVLELLARGLSNAEIADAAFLSRRTVDHHVSAILRKLGVPSRREAIALVRRL